MARFSSLIFVALLIIGCGAGKRQVPLSLETKLKRAEMALENGRIFEAKKWTTEALKTNPKLPEPQRLMARILDREIVSEKLSSKNRLPEELTLRERAARAKTLTERGRGLLQANELGDAMRAAEKALQLDPENLEASHLMDDVKEKARRQGREESLFVQNLYQEEINARIQRYTQDAETWTQEGKWGAARLAVEKILLLDPKNSEGLRLSKILDEEESKSLSPLQQVPAGAK